MTSYTDEQVRDAAHAYRHNGFAHGAQILESLLADRTRLQAEAIPLRYELSVAREKFDALLKQLMCIYGLLYPMPVELEDGRVMAFRPKTIDPHEVLQQLSDAIRSIPEAIDSARAKKGGV